MRAAQVEQALEDIKDSVCCHPTIDGHKVRFEAFGSNAFEFLVLFHVSSFNDRWQVITEANMDLLRRFEAHGIRLAAPMHVTVNTDTMGLGSWRRPTTCSRNKVEAATASEMDVRLGRRDKLDAAGRSAEASCPLQPRVVAPRLLRQPRIVDHPLQPVPESNPRPVAEQAPRHLQVGHEAAQAAALLAVLDHIRPFSRQLAQAPPRARAGSSPRPTPR